MNSAVTIFCFDPGLRLGMRSLILQHGSTDPFYSRAEERTVLITQSLKRESTMPFDWIAGRLAMGARSTVNRALPRWETALQGAESGKTLKTLRDCRCLISRIARFRAPAHYPINVTLGEHATAVGRSMYSISIWENGHSISRSGETVR